MGGCQQWDYIGVTGVILGLYGDNRKEDGNYFYEALVWPCSLHAWHYLAMRFRLFRLQIISDREQRSMDTVAEERMLV